MEREQSGGTGPQQPDQAEGDRETIEQDIASIEGGDDPGQVAGNESRHGATPAARSPEQRPSQAEGERS